MREHFILLGLIASLFLHSCNDNSPQPLLIATAANMQFAIPPILETFTEATGILCEPIISSSGKLTAQIKAGAPYSVFLSADMKYPEVLYQEGLTIAEPKIYTYGTLVLWSLAESNNLSLDLLSSSSISHIALANPKTAPYGKAAMEVLQHLNISTTLKEKLVFGESIAQTNQFITSQVAELGFTAKSVVMSPTVKGQGQWITIDTSLYSPIEQGIVLLKNTPDKLREAQLFYDFLLSEKGQAILQEHGY